MAGYRVLIVIKNTWWSDQKSLPSFRAAQEHRKHVAARWSSSDTAIVTPDGRVLAFRESLLEQRALAALAAEARGASAP